MIELASDESINKFVRYARISEGDEVADKLLAKLHQLRDEGEQESVDGFDILAPIVEEEKPGLAEAWEAAGDKRVFGSLRPESSDAQEQPTEQ